MQILVRPPAEDKLVWSARATNADQMDWHTSRMKAFPGTRQRGCAPQTHLRRCFLGVYKLTLKKSKIPVPCSRHGHHVPLGLMGAVHVSSETICRICKIRWSLGGFQLCVVSGQSSKALVHIFVAVTGSKESDRNIFDVSS